MGHAEGKLKLRADSTGLLTTRSLRQLREVGPKSFGDRQLQGLYEFYRDNSVWREKKVEGLTLGAMATLLAPLGWTDPKVVSALFDQFDSDNNGVVDFRELVVGLGIMIEGSADEKLEMFFKVFDEDGSGVLEKAEVEHMVRTIMRASGLHSGKAEIMSLLNTAQLDRVVAEWVAEFMDRLDISSDGVISPEEFARAMRHPELEGFLGLIANPASAAEEERAKGG